jgi:hypothetical protein
MKYRKLRIAWSVGCGVVCLLLVVLWVRSYWRYDHVFFPGPHRIASMNGRISLDENFIMKGPIPTWRLDLGAIRLVSVSGNLTPSGVGRAIPHYLLATMTALLAIAPWLPSRFSLRALLVAMTFVAVGLGVVVYMLRN